MNVYAIMPTFNQAAFLREAVESIEYQVDYLTVVDDGSTDGETPTLGLELAEEFDIGFFGLGKNRGTAAAINAGTKTQAWRMADLVTWVSSDNVHLPDWRETLEAALADEDVGVAYSAYFHGSYDRPYHTHYDAGRLIKSTNCFFGPSFLMRREVWDAAGPHRGRISHDYDHWLRVEEVCWRRGLHIVAVDTPLCFYRVHPGRVTETRKHEFDAGHWQEVAKERRACSS